VAATASVQLATLASMSLSEWLAEHPPPDSAFKQSLADVGRRAGSPPDFLIAVRELLDEVALMRGEQIARAIGEAPPPTGDPRHDAYLGALAEHLALEHGLPVPGWCREPTRFLERFWFPSTVRGFRALAIAQSPAAFRRRGIFIARGSLQRV
jgi:hypothetical protein